MLILVLKLPTLQTKLDLRTALHHFHWVKVKDAKIERYQIITPTAWNASPRDSSGVRGPFEEAVVGTEIKDPDNPIEVEHIIRSFDPCLVCTVHAIDLRKPLRKITI